MAGGVIRIAAEARVTAAPLIIELTTETRFLGAGGGIAWHRTTHADRCCVRERADRDAMLLCVLVASKQPA